MWTTESRSRYDRRGLRYPSDLTGSELVIPYAHQIMNLVGDAKKAVSNRAQPAGSLVIGCLETVLAMHLGGVRLRLGNGPAQAAAAQRPRV